MTKIYRSFAKINLHLEVAGRREDGYHELRTIFQTISLCDRIEISLAGEGVELELEGRDVVGGGQNLAHRAATAFRERWGGPEGVRLRLDKRIPVEGGLGGGSSNAATVLLALRDLYGEPAEISALVEVAASLGADVPYFLVGGTAYGDGRGDRVETVPELDEEELLLILPPGGVSTRSVFESGLLTYRDEPEPLIEAVRTGRVTSAARAVGINDLEPAVLALSPEVRAVYTSLVQAGAKKIRVSGSGATMFAFRSQIEKERELISEVASGVRVLGAQTLSRASIETRRVVKTLGGP